MKLIRSIIKRCLVLLIVMTGSVTLLGQTLQEYQALAARRNAMVRASFTSYLAALEKVPQVKGLPDPTVMFAYFIQPVETRVGAQQFSAGVSQMFPWFGTLSAKADVATSMAEAKYQDFVDARNKVFYEVAATYYQWYMVEQSIQLTNDNLELLESFRQMANTRFESGKAKFVDILRIEMEQEELRTQLDLLQNSRQPLQTKLAELMDTTTVQPPVFPDSLTLPDGLKDRAALRDSILRANPKLARLEKEKEAFANQQEAARKMGMPSFSLGLNYINITPRTDMEVPQNGKDALIFPQVGVSIPIFRSKYKAMEKEAVLMQETTELKTDQLENQLQTQLDETLRDYADAQRKVATYHKLYRLARQSRSLIVTEYTTASGQFEEVLRMERKELEYQLELEKAKAALATKVAFINYLIGQ